MEKAEKTISRSTVEAYVGIIVAIYSVVFPMNWISTAILLAIVLLMITDMVYRNPWTSPHKALTGTLTLVVFLVAGAGFAYKVIGQRESDRQKRLDTEYSPNVLRQDNSATLDLKTRSYIEIMRQLHSQLDSRFSENDKRMALEERNALSSEGRNQFAIEGQKKNAELYADMGELFRRKYLAIGWYLESELINRAKRIYLGPRGKILPPQHFPSPPELLAHGDLYGPSPFMSVAKYFEELLELQ